MFKGLVSASVLLLVASVSHGACSWADEESLATLTLDRANRGEATRTDVALADLNLLEARFQCRDIRIVPFCSKAESLVKVIITGINEEARVGQRSTQDIVNAQATGRRIQKICATDFN